MAAYSMDLRERVLEDWDRGLKADDVAAKYRGEPVRGCIAWCSGVERRARSARGSRRVRPQALAGQRSGMRALVAARPSDAGWAAGRVAEIAASRRSGAH